MPYYWSNTVEPHLNGPVSNGNQPITEAILETQEICSFIFYIGSNRNLPLSRQVGIQLQEDKNKKETHVRQRECEQNSHKMVIFIKKCLLYVMIH